jgi:hypothetical protein
MGYVLREDNSHVSLLGEFDFSELLSLGHHVLVLDSHDTTTPGSPLSLVVVVLGSEVLGEHLEVGVVLLLDLGEGHAGGGLGVDELSESCLSLDEAVWDSLLSAESRQVAHDLEGVGVVSNSHELGLAVLTELGHVVEAELKDDGLGAGAVLGGLVNLSVSVFLKSFLLFFSSLGGVLR